MRKLDRICTKEDRRAYLYMYSNTCILLLYHIGNQLTTRSFIEGHSLGTAYPASQQRYVCCACNLRPDCDRNPTANSIGSYTTTQNQHQIRLVMTRCCNPNMVTKTSCARVRVDIATLCNCGLSEPMPTPMDVRRLGSISLSIEDGVRGRFRKLKRNLADELALKCSNLDTSWTCDRDRESKISMIAISGYLSSLKCGGQVQLSRGILASFAQGRPPVQRSDGPWEVLIHRSHTTCGPGSVSLVN